MAEHPPEYEYRVTMEQIGSDGMFHPHISTTPDAPSAIKFANARRKRDDHRNVTVERRFAGPWHPVADGDEVPAADRQRIVFDVVSWFDQGCLQAEFKYRGIVGVHEIPEPRGTEVRLLVDLDAPVIDAF